MSTSEKELNDLDNGSYDREELRENVGAYKLSEEEAMEGSDFDDVDTESQNMGRCSAEGNEVTGPGSKTA